MLRLQVIEEFTRSSLRFFAIAIVLVAACVMQAQESDSDSVMSMAGHEAGEEGKRLYRAKEYDEALPYLQVAAEWGLKDAQARLGQIYFKGLGSAEKNPLRGLAWLGTAASKPTSTGFEKMYAEALADVPDEQTSTVESVVSAYSKKFGSGEAAVKCRMLKPLGSNMSQLSCDYDERWEHSGDIGTSWDVHKSSEFSL